MRGLACSVLVGCGAGCGPSSGGSAGSGDGTGGSTTVGEGQTSSGHPLGWSCGDGVVVTGEYCFRELRLDGIDVVTAAFGDLTGDGRPDVVVQTREDLRSYAIHDDGQFELLDVWADGGSSGTRLFVGDFDDDSRLDVARVYQRTIELFVQQSDGSMAEPLVSLETIQPYVNDPANTMDVDRDGNDELLVVTNEPGWGEAPYVTGMDYRTGEWSATTKGFDFWYPYAWAIADMDGDGLDDPVVFMDPEEAERPREFIPETFDMKSAHLGWLRPDGAGIALGATLAPGFYPREVELGDIDGDGHVDVMLMNESERYHYVESSPSRVIYWGRGNWEFDGPHDMGDVWGKVIDVEGDGVAEIVQRLRDPLVIWNYTDGTFQSNEVHSPICAGLTGGDHLADVNADGVMDCVKRSGISWTNPIGAGSLVVLLSDP
jgi:hypothetical protein